MGSGVKHEKKGQQHFAAGFYRYPLPYPLAHMFIVVECSKAYQAKPVERGGKTGARPCSAQGRPPSLKQAMADRPQGKPEKTVSLPDCDLMLFVV